MIIWKGKGILIFLYFIVTGIGLAIVYRILIEHLGLSDKAPVEVFMGLVLIITGIWTKLTADTYYIDKEGKKRFLDIENDLFFIKMKTWGFILPSIGAGLIIYGVINSF